MYKLGALPSPKDEKDYIVRAVANAATLPAYWDFRGVMQPVRNQGNEGTCVPHAVSSGVMGYFQQTKPHGSPYQRTNGIRTLYQAARERGGLTSGEGCHVRDALEIARRDGINLETDCPYQPYTYPPEGSESWKHKLENKIGSYASVELNVAAIKTALYYYGPLVAVIPVMDGFWTPNIYGKVNKAGTNNGYHAVTFVGWDDKENSILVRNSWGVEWGLKGHCLLPFNDYPITEVWSATPNLSVYSPPAPKPWWMFW